MKILIACEYSGAVRDSFLASGHDAMSCDLLPTDSPGPHYQGDIRDVLDFPWDLMIAHPPCTDLAVSGAAWFKNKRMIGAQQTSVSFFMMLAKADIPRICIENPVCIMSTLWRKPDQIIQPYMFGHRETKATCLWLKGLPPLTPTDNVKEETMALPERERMRLHYLPPSADRWKIRSETFSGIAKAMAEQWGNIEDTQNNGRQNPMLGVPVPPTIKKHDQDSARKDPPVDLQRVPGQDQRINLSKETKK